MIQFAKAAAGAVLAVALLSGCAGPRLVSSMSKTSEGKYRFVWSQTKNNFFSAWTEQGIVDCDKADSGQMTQCKPVKLVFIEKEEAK